MKRVLIPALLALSFAGMLLAEYDEQMSDPSQPAKKFVRNYLDAVMDPTFDDWDKYFSETITFNNDTVPSRFLGNPIGFLLQGFPDLEFHVEGQIAEGDRIATWGYFQGTHEGVFNGLRPTGREFKWFGVAIDRLKGGKVVEMSHEMDLWGLMQRIEKAESE